MYPQTEKTTEVLKDLIKINDDRINVYETGLTENAIKGYERLDSAIHDIINTIILDGVVYKQQLSYALKQIDEDPKRQPNIVGKIYHAWNDLKGRLICTTSKSMISSCLYNEEIALYAYRAALNEVIGLTNDALHVIGWQKDELKKNHALLKSYRMMRRSSDASLMYLA